MKYILTYLILLFSAVSALAQNEDAGLWMFFNLEKDLPKKYTTGVELETRLNENLSEAASLFAQPYLMKEWTKAFSTTISYRMQLSRELNNLYNGQDRLNLDLKYKKKIKSLDIGLQYRLRLQKRLGIINTESPFRSSSAVRHRLKLDYSLSKKWKLALAGEGFYRVLSEENAILFSDVRIKFSARYKVKKRNYLNLGYLVQNEYNKVNPIKEFIGVIGYTLMIK